MDYSQANIEALFRLIGSFPGHEFVETEDFDFIKTKDSIWPNQLINLKAEVSNLNQVLSHIENESAQGRLPNILMSNPSDDDPVVVDLLKKRGYRSSQWAAMTHDLTILDSENHFSEIEFNQVHSQDQLKEWIALVELELMGGEKLNAEIFSNLLKHLDCYFFLASSKSETVGTAFLFVAGKTAGIYLVSTLKSHRRKGIGKEITRRCLEKAKSLGCTQVDIQATELGRGVYLSLGFINKGFINVFKIQK